jgi:serine protease AprX
MSPTDRLTIQTLLRREYPFHRILFPKIAETESFTTSPVARTRAASYRQLSLMTPSKAGAETLQRLGLNSLRTAQANKRPLSGRGLYTSVDSLGLTVAYFADDGALHDAEGELSDGYDFVPDVPLAMSAPLERHGTAMTTSKAAVTNREWPDASGVKQAHDKGVRGAGVLVGVLDTGVDADHDEFQGVTIPYRYVSFFPDSPYWPPRDVRGYDTDGHGTHVAGIIAGRHVGVAPESQLYAATVIESETTRTSLIRVVYGLSWLLRSFGAPGNENRPAILNLSLGFPPSPPPDMSPDDYTSALSAMARLIDTLRQANVLPVIAIGNEGPGNYGYPGAFPNVLGVGAVDFQHSVASFSGSGLGKPDLVGYGVAVHSSLERDYSGHSIYRRLSGTSMATPYVSGIAALIRCEFPDYTVSEVTDKLLSTAIPLTDPASRVGRGLARYA